MARRHKNVQWIHYVTLAVVCVVIYLIIWTTTQHIAGNYLTLDVRNNIRGVHVLQNHETTRQHEGTPKAPRVLCWLLTEQGNLDTRAKAARDTWTRRCDKTLFFSSTTNSSFPTIGLDIPKGRSHLTTKALMAFAYSHKHYGQHFDWFLKADDDTYVIMENLRHLVRSRDPSAPIYFGYRFKPYTPQGYMSGGAGYLLSRESLRRLVVDGLLGRQCDTFWGIEDLDIGKCLHTVGVKASESLDDLGKERFHPLSLNAYFSAIELPGWAYSYAYHPLQKETPTRRTHQQAIVTVPARSARKVVQAVRSGRLHQQDVCLQVELEGCTSRL
ncbi:unnamed protein product [Lymnaea stagnalis]|uniref:N-acetylgalactosaminide beta-1,3-galactosyltransferase n=1 Tax=Lymnaea stagnalis TaxID=6523 RepID=A0AAV2H9N5_LYMST